MKLFLVKVSLISIYQCQLGHGVSNLRVQNLLDFIKKNEWLQEQKSGVILTSMEPNILKMLFSINNQKIMML